MTKEPHRDSLPPGTGLLGEYRIERELGSDRFAVTYLAHEPGLDRQVVITEYLPPASSARRGDGTVGPRSDEHAEAFAAGLARFLEGARVLASVDHPGIGKVHRIAEADGTAYLVTEHVRGRSLASEIEAPGPLSGGTAGRMLEGLATGVAEVQALPEPAAGDAVRRRPQRVRGFNRRRMFYAAAIAVVAVGAAIMILSLIHI